MAQKVNSNIFRLGIKKNEWKSKYFESTNEEFSLYTYQSLEIKKFLQKFLKINGLLFHNFKIQYSGNTLYLFVSYYTTSKINSLINEINEYQKIKIKKYTFYRQPKPKKGKKRVIRLNKQVFQLQKLIPVFINRHNNIKNNLKKKYIRRIINKQRQNTLKRKTKKRINFLKNYKNTLQMIRYNNIKHLKLNNFSEQLLESLSIFTNNNFNIFVTFQNLNKGFSLALDNIQANFLKKKLLGLRRESRNKFFKETVNILLITVLKENSAQLLAEYIASQLKTMKKHSFFLIFIKRFLITLISEKNFSKVSGVKIAIKGRFNGAPRARKRIYITGNVPVQTIDSTISHYQATSYTLNGTFGVKVWVCGRK